MTGRINLPIGMLAIMAAILMSANAAHAQGRDPSGRDSQAVRGTIKSVNATSITITYGGGRETPATERTFTLAKNVELCVGGGNFGFRIGALYKEITIKDLTEGTSVVLELTADQKTAVTVIAEEPTVRGRVKSVDAAKRSVTVTISSGGRDPAGEEEKTYAVASDAEIGIDDGRGRRFSIRESKLDDVAAGAHVNLRLSLDRKQVNVLFAEASAISGTVKSVDAAKSLITLVVRPARGDDAAEERTIAVAKDGLVLIDDGKGRRLSVKQAKLADIPVGSAVIGKLSMDQNFVMMLKAEGPMLSGILKGVNPDKGTVTIGIPINRTELEEKTFSVVKGALVTLDGKDAKLGDLKVEENGPFIQLRLTLDQTAVQVVRAQIPGSR